MATRMPAEFALESEPKGYQNKQDKTNLPPGVLIDPSHDVLTTPGNRWGNRKGFTLDGQASSATGGIKSNYDWLTHNNTWRHLRAGGTTDDLSLEFRYVADDGSVSWETLIPNLTSAYFNFTKYWDAINAQAYLLMVNGESSITEWSGGVGQVASVDNTSGAILTINSNAQVWESEIDTGSGYHVGDLLTVTTGDGNATVRVLEIANGMVATVAIGANGSGYSMGNTLLIGAPNGVGAFVRVDTVDGGGGITAVTLLNPGSGYYSTGNYVASGGGGTGARINVTAIADGGVQNVTVVDAGTGYAPGTGQTTSGGFGTGFTFEILTVSQNSITLEGDLTVPELGFYYAANPTAPYGLVVDGINFTYTAVSGNTFLNVFPDPTTAGLSAGDLIFQAVKVTLNSDIADLPDDLGNDLISTLNNQIFVGALDNRTVYVSHVNDYTDFSFTSPQRINGEGAAPVLDSNPTVFIPQEQTMYISAGADQWYEVEYKDLGDNGIQELIALPLKTTPGQGALSQAATSKTLNDVIFISNEPTLSTLGRIIGVVLTPQTSNLSDPIKNLFDTYDFANASVFYNRYFYYIAVPAEGVVLIFNVVKNYWEAPQTLPISRFAVIEGELYGHSSTTAETYKLFDGYNDNGAPIDSLAAFSFQNYGQRGQKKYFNQYYAEGYISGNASLTIGVQYETDGCAISLSKVLNGTDPQVCAPLGEGNLGAENLGKWHLGGGLIPMSAGELPPKFRIIETFVKRPFYECSYYFQSIGQDFNWELLAFGGKVERSGDQNIGIKN